MRKFLLIFILFISINNVYAVDTNFPFVDVKPQDELYKDLSTLYNNHVIKVPEDKLFHPDSLIPRDEFVWIVVWIWCRECINPSSEDFIKYNTLPFLDVEITNPYFYCISAWKEDWIIQWYLLNDKQEYTCQNNQSYKEVPFCPANNITRIEATTVLLRSAKIWNDELNSKVTKTITISDVDDKWYWFAKKWIEVWILKKDENNKIYPNEYINKREFVHMAVKIFWMNFCEVKTNKNSLSWDIKIYNKDNANSCSLAWNESELDTPSISVYDIVWFTESNWDFDYSWEFRNSTTWETKTAAWKCLNDYDLITNWKWIIKLTIKDKNSSRSTTAYSQIYVSKWQKWQLSVSINAMPIYWEEPLQVNLSSIVKWNIWKTEYFWDFGDYEYSDQINPFHRFNLSWIYTVSLKVRDSEWNTWIAQLVVEVTKNIDSDWDWILDKNDKCPKVIWQKDNYWCPKVSEYNNFENNGNNSNNSNNSGKTKSNYSACQSSRVNQYWSIEWTLSCYSCPCSFSADFLSTLRSCDIIFPAITSPNKHTLFSRWNIFQVD